MAPSILILLAVLSMHPAPRRDSSVQKVWTNDDIDTLRANVPISQFTVSVAPLTAAVAPPANVPPIANPPYIRELDPDWYAKEIGTIQMQIAASHAVIQKIEDIRSSGVGISGTIPLDREDPGLTPETTIQILQARTSLLKAGADTLEELARRNDIPPGEIR